MSLTQVTDCFNSEEGLFLGAAGKPPTERDFFVDNLLVRIHLIIEVILVVRPCAMEV
jgi:hypothetical protein